MLTLEDIQKLTEFQQAVFVNTAHFDEALEEVKEKISVLQTSVDALVKEKVIADTEKTTLAYRMKNVEDWVDEASPKLNLDFKH